jgi:hypothetical protein
MIKLKQRPWPEGLLFSASCILLFYKLDLLFFRAISNWKKNLKPISIYNLEYRFNRPSRHPVKNRFGHPFNQTLDPGSSIPFNRTLNLRNPVPFIQDGSITFRARG